MSRYMSTSSSNAFALIPTITDLLSGKEYFYGLHRLDIYHTEKYQGFLDCQTSVLEVLDAVGVEGGETESSGCP